MRAEGLCLIEPLLLACHFCSAWLDTPVPASVHTRIRSAGLAHGVVRLLFRALLAPADLDRPRPLALYYFGSDKAETQRVLQETVSGGVTVNDVMLHIGQHDMPFGGVGASGMGAYHGQVGFDAMSKLKPVLIFVVAAGLIGVVVANLLGKL